MKPSVPAQKTQWEFPATLDNVGRVCTAAGAILDQVPLQKKDRFAAELLLREALNNAVLHGCNEDPLLSFSCALTISDEEMVIEVTDQGAGFDWRSELQTLPGILRETGRGLPIYRAYAHSTIFNEAGNCVTLTRILNKKIKNIDQGDIDD
jgi:serine/threonine-protein kinase RsbW